ncbi:hypothetical protein GH714_040986 [Hevea brasiliensis]|uniref:Mandelate racemase/muconate lactonizing enzyme C-terminal domain-containing protein n=1 Tax=Hevea brasiliensis TaxID=3981 RepID=A0A6A6N7N0_HEVBR|nr:hypothetical protein GH714_040986 [Hevea brasiliensis]
MAMNVVNGNFFQGFSCKHSDVKPSKESGNTCMHPVARITQEANAVVEAVRFDGPIMGIMELEDDEDFELVIETCITRTLSPAATLERGLQSIREAVEELKLNPPPSGSGVLRFQVAVPPSPKALNWFCCQLESSGVFPQFFVSKETENPSSSSSIKHEAGSFYLVIPEIELDEHGDISILSATLAWDDAYFCTFKQAIQSFESSIYQAGYHFCPTVERCCSNYTRSAFNKLKLVEDKTLQMVSSNALLLDGRDYQNDLLELVSPFSWIKIIPLAIAASTHPLTTCIACYDERSLAFHAVGYARGSRSPAVVITSSGTAVSNLFPAVVEASQDFVPLILLTADRPPELQNAGANQSINQVNHFGSFVRFFFSLPTPTDDIPARMVLTTLDSAVHWATSSPYGPVHINCPFREPLDDFPNKWTLGCLKGLDNWMSSGDPFTKYIQMQNSLACNGNAPIPMKQVREIIQGGKRGLLLVGEIHTEDEIWAALLLAKQLNWPVVADILSGLRLRKLSSYFPKDEENVLFVDHLDHALLSDLVRVSVQFDVVIQIGSRITSKRISQMLEECCLCSYIVVDNHPFRHDPSHFVSHRVHCSILHFVDSLIKAQFPCRSSKWCGYLGAVDKMVASDISFQIFAENSLTEPHVAHVISEALSADSALFVGNSMAIRDADMYGYSHKNHIHGIADMNSEIQCLGIRVAGNRGASGIDGLLSTAIGFAVGCNKRVLCMIGDVSFLHDTNGLSIFNQSVRHLQVKTKVELRDALLVSQHQKTDCVIEVESSISANAIFHRIQLRAPPTSASVDHDHSKFHKEGYILLLSLEDGSVGYGEVAPLEIHKENLLDVEEQLRFLLHVIKGTEINLSLPLLKGSFSTWIWNNLGIPENSIFPSVRCGLEMAILNAIAESHGSSLLNITRPQKEKEEIYETSNVKICGLIDSTGTPAEVAFIASSLVEEGFSALKLKLQEVRKKVGRQIELRVDANRNWSYEEAIRFGSLVKDCDLQYIEEPVKDEDDIIKYCKESGLPVALDETIDNFCENPLDMLVKYAHPGIVAVVIKPSVVGGFERAALIAQWAHQQGKMAVVSAAFESGLTHGLGTYQWLKQDITTKTLGIHRDPCSGFMGASIAGAIQLLQGFQINQSVIHRTFTGDQVRTYHLAVNSKDFSGSIKVQEVGETNNDNVVIFLHGFLGTGEDWISIMKAISGSARCISIDLPGHGRSRMKNCGCKDAKQEATLSVEIVAHLFYNLIQDITPGKVALVGYSMGARIALHMALRHGDKISGAVIISGSPGLKDGMARRIRWAKDFSRSRLLMDYGLELFLDSWYAGELWNSLRSHPCFKELVGRRMLHDDVYSLAKVLSDLSVGRQMPLWEDLKQCNIPLLLVVGEKDKKFRVISQKMCYEISQFRKGRNEIGNNFPEIVEVPNCGHAVHLENPLAVIWKLRQFLTKLRKFSTLEYSEKMHQSTTGNADPYDYEVQLEKELWQRKSGIGMACSLKQILNAEVKSIEGPMRYFMLRTALEQLRPGFLS